MALFRPTAVEHERIVERLERELAETKAVLADCMEEQGLPPPLPLFQFHCSELDDGARIDLEDTQDGPSVIRAENLDDAFEVLSNYLHDINVDPGDGDRVRMSIWPIDVGGHRRNVLDVRIDLGDDRLWSGFDNDR